ncbi:MAG: MarR family transcriptional regulator [Steroidobacteraceae bacterium]
MAARDHSTHPAVLIYDCAKHLRIALAARLEEYALTPAMWRCLAYLDAHAGASLSALAETLEVRSMSIMRVIDELERRGLVRRAANPRDRRALQLFLTPAGEPIVVRLWQLIDEIMDEARAGLTAAQRRDLLQGLQSLRAGLQRQSARGGRP